MRYHIMPIYSAKAVADDAKEIDRGIQRKRPLFLVNGYVERGNGDHAGKIFFKFPHRPWKTPRRRNNANGIFCADDVQLQ